MKKEEILKTKEAVIAELKLLILKEVTADDFSLFLELKLDDLWSTAHELGYEAGWDSGYDSGYDDGSFENGEEI
jgi:hypothetical protein